MNGNDNRDIRQVLHRCGELVRYPKLMAVGGLGLALMLGAPLMEEEKMAIPNSDSTYAVEVRRSDEKVWEEKLEKILSSIDGAGKVEVAVQIDEEKRIEHEKNRTHEKRTVTEGENGAETIEEKITEELPMRRENGVESPIARRTLRPAVKGVLVVAEGGASSAVREDIRDAVETATGVAPYRIKVLAKKREGISR